MAYYIDLFSPETYMAFAQSQRDISGFRLRHKNLASRVKPGDVFVCYLTRLSRWFGLLEVVEGPFIDSSPLFEPDNDPYPVRFKVRETVWLDFERALPIHDDAIWEGLSFTRGLEKGSLSWTGKVRESLVQLDEQDGKFLSQKLLSQKTSELNYPLSEQDKRKLATHTVTRQDKVVAVSVPEDSTSVEAKVTPPDETRESIRVQALIASIGAQMGMRIWLPRADRANVLKEWKNAEGTLLERLPLNYDDTTLRTIEQIDVIWLRGRSIVRAFEVEHTTSIYSGILRMADLLALQPNMDIRLHIVAPDVKREKVFQEIRRPVFSLLEKGPLAESCTFLSYANLRELAKLKHLEHLLDTVIEEYSEEAE